MQSLVRSVFLSFLFRRSTCCGSLKRKLQEELTPLLTCNEGQAPHPNNQQMTDKTDAKLNLGRPRPHKKDCSFSPTPTHSRQRQLLNLLSNPTRPPPPTHVPTAEESSHPSSRKHNSHYLHRCGNPKTSTFHTASVSRPTLRTSEGEQWPPSIAHQLQHTPKPNGKALNKQIDWNGGGSTIYIPLIPKICEAFATTNTTVSCIHHKLKLPHQSLTNRL